MDIQSQIAWLRCFDYGDPNLDSAGECADTMQLMLAALQEIASMPNESWIGNIQTIGDGLENCHKVALAALEKSSHVPHKG